MPFPWVKWSDSRPCLLFFKTNFVPCGFKREYCGLSPFIFSRPGFIKSNAEIVPGLLSLAHSFLPFYVFFFSPQQLRERCKDELYLLPPFLVALLMPAPSYELHLSLEPAFRPCSAQGCESTADPSGHLNLQFCGGECVLVGKRTI